MPYFIFQKNSDNIEGSLFKIAENLSDLDSLNIIKSDYKIIEDNQDNFNAVKFGTKVPVKYNNDLIVYENITSELKSKNHTQYLINKNKESIEIFLKNNKNSLFYVRLNDYKNQLNNLNLDSISYPLNKSLEQYFNDLGQPSFNILQIP